MYTINVSMMTFSYIDLLNMKTILSSILTQREREKPIKRRRETIKMQNEQSISKSHIDPKTFKVSVSVTDVNVNVGVFIDAFALPNDISL